MSKDRIDRILVIHFGQLGDVILGLPALDALRERFPDAHVDVMTGKSPAQIVRLWGRADEVLPVDRVALRDGPRFDALREIVRIVRRARAARYDLVVDLHTYYETGLLVWLTGARTRVGSWRSRRTLSAAYTSLAPWGSDDHFVDRFLDVVRLVGAEPRTRDPRVHICAEALAAAEALLEAKFGDARGRPLVALNPGAGWEIRRWPAERFVEVGRNLARRGALVCVFSGPEERGLATRIAEEIGPAAAGLEGTPLAEFAAIVTHADLVISNDTGPAHLAAATGTPVVVLVRGSRGESTFAVRSERARMLFGDEIADITTADVLAAAGEFLRYADPPGAL